MASAGPSGAAAASSSSVKSSTNSREDNLINLIDKEEATLACVQDFIKSRDGAVDLNERNTHGRTALMIACLKGKLDIVKYLLDEGADPNLTTPGEGNTAFHFACMYTPIDDKGDSASSAETEDANSGSTSSGKDKTKKGLEGTVCKADQIILHIALLLLLHKAESQENHDGLYPLDYAALNKRLVIIAFFGSKELVAKSYIVRALEILGVTFALEDKCDEAFRVFEKAIAERQSNPDDPLSIEFTSDLEGFLEQKECRTTGSLKAYRKKKHAIKVQAFLVGDRVLPEGMKPKLLYEQLAKYGHELLLRKKTRAKAFSIFDACLHLERKGLFYLNTVLMYLRMSVPMAETLESLKEPQFINGTCKILTTYIDVVKDVSCDHLEKSVKDMMCNLGRILYDVVDQYSSLKTLEQFLTPISKMINVIWDRIPKPEATGSGIVFPTISVCHNVLLHLGREFCPNFLFFRALTGTSKYTNFLFKRLIAHLLHVEGALDVDCRGNTMIHTLMVYSQTLAPHMIIDIAELLIRHGCPTESKNKEGETPYDIVKTTTRDSDEDDYDDEDDEDEDDEDDEDENHACKMEMLSDLLKGPKKVYSLQELAARSILLHRIPYHERLPPSLFTILRDPIQDEEEEEEEEDSEMYSDYDSDFCL